MACPNHFLAVGSDLVSDSKIISDPDQIMELQGNLRSYGGSGKTDDGEKITSLKNEIDMLQQEYESKLKPIVLEIAFNLEAQMEKMSDDEIFEKFEVRDAKPSMIGDCVYNICQQLERQPSYKSIIEMMPEKFKPN